MEVWKTIKGFEDYQVSNLGNVKSLNYRKQGIEKLLKPIYNNNGYLFVILSKDNKRKYNTIHQLVAIAFLNHEPCGYKFVVNHKNFIRTDNNLKNLEIVTHRQNTNQKHLKSSSQYTGVSWNKNKKKWFSIIYVNGKNKYLGSFKNEIEAHNKYELALKNLPKKNPYE